MYCAPLNACLINDLCFFHLRYHILQIIIVQKIYMMNDDGQDARAATAVRVSRALPPDGDME